MSRHAFDHIDWDDTSAQDSAQAADCLGGAVMLDLTQFDGHTPGPWVPVEVMGAAVGFAVGDAERKTIACVVKAFGAEPLPSRINARLIAAAPELLTEVIRLRAELEALMGASADLVADVDGLIGESAGVAGLHLNGDVAEWDALLPGGRFERLSSLDIVRELSAVDLLEVAP